MGTRENEDESLAERVSRLESRIARIEAAVTQGLPPTPAVPPPPVVPSATGPGTYWQTP